MYYSTDFFMFSRSFKHCNISEIQSGTFNNLKSLRYLYGKEIMHFPLYLFILL